MAYKRISPIPVVEGGTNATSMATTDGTVYFDGTSLVTTTTGTAGWVLTSGGAGVAPTYQAVSASGAVTSVSGGNNITITGTATAPIVNVSGTTQHAVQVGNATNSLTSLSVGTNGQVLLGSSAADPSFVTPTAGSGLSVTTNASTLSYAINAPVSIANGGTNATSMATTDGVVYFDGTRLVTTAVGSATQVLTSNGPGVAPTFQAAGGGGGITTLDGDTGSATGSTVTVKANVASFNCGATVKFSGSGSTLTMNVTDNLENTIIGQLSGNSGSLTGVGNTMLGYAVGSLLTTGGSNVLIGLEAAESLTTGSDNVCIGFNAGGAYTGAESDNICIGHNNIGITAETNTLHLGNGTGTGPGNLQAAYISGINGVNVSSSTATVVTMTAGSDQLGTATITAGTGITVTPTANTITITSTAPLTGHSMLGTAGVTSSTSAAQFWGPYGSAAQSTALAVEMPIPVAGTLKNLYFSVTANASSSTDSLTVYRNGSATSIIISLTAGSTGTKSDTTHTQAVSAGDLIAFRTSQSTTGTWTGNVSLQLVA